MGQQRRNNSGGSSFLRDALVGSPISGVGDRLNESMEKHEKILAGKQRTIRTVFGVIFATGCVVLLWALLNMPPDDIQAANAAAVIDSKRPQEETSPQQLRRNPLLQATHDDEAQQAKARNTQLAAAVIAPRKIDPAIENMMVSKVVMYDTNVRKIKKNLPNKVFMETDETALAATKELQDATRDLLYYRYGALEPYRIKFDLKFQRSQPTFATMGEKDSFVIELAPSALVPHSIYSFLEIARHFHLQKGAFHRRADHVLQAMVKGHQVEHLAFQEYSPKFPHFKGTVGYAGRPSGPEFYVSIQNNVGNHGPGTQQAYNPHEADSCFGKVVEGFEEVVLKRITKMPGSGFLKPPMHVLIDAMTILVPDAHGEYQIWQDHQRPTE